MDLTFSASEEAFREEARSWLEANVPRSPLPSGDTAEGFALHVQWEKRLFEGRWAVVFSPLDLSCALEAHESLQCRGYTRQDAARIALNVLVYSLNW